jgi:hypothetical protein
LPGAIAKPNTKIRQVIALNINRTGLNLHLH